MRFRSILGSLALLAALPGTAQTLIKDQDHDVVRPHPVARPLTAKLEALDFYGSQEALNLRFSLTNHLNHSIWILRWQVPTEDMDAHLFTVTRDGEAVSYEGPLVKRAQPEASDYIEIKPGATFSAVFDPSAHYDMSLQGQYQMNFRGQRLAIRHTAPEQRNLDLEASLLIRRDQESPMRLDTLPQDQLGLNASASASFAFQGVPGGSRKAFVESVIGGYTKCTTAQQGLLKTAHANAITLTSKSNTYLGANPNGSTLETTWFGAFNSSRHATVKDHFVKANAAFVNQNVVYDCGCKQSAYAYVYANQPYKIYLCKAFWNAPALGRDSKAGTLVHEMMHFTVVAGTSDYVYGATGAMNLAKTNPANAIMNSDNHEYFAEDQK